MIAEATFPDHTNWDDDDALIYHGSATFDDWRCHVPLAVVEMWKQLDKTARAAVFMTAMGATMWNDPNMPEEAQP